MFGNQDARVWLCNEFQTCKPLKLEIWSFTVQKCTAEQPGLLNKPDEQGFYPLQWAALNNRKNVVHWLIENGAQINQVDHTGQTALHWAAVRGSLPSTEMLLNSGADLQIRDCRGWVQYFSCHLAHTSHPCEQHRVPVELSNILRAMLIDV